MHPRLRAAALALCLVSGLAWSQTPSLSFTMETTAAAGGQVVPKLTWATTPAAASCTATGDAAWAGTKSATGTLTLAAITPPKSYSLRCNWPGDTQATVSWTAPTSFEPDPATPAQPGAPLPKCATATDTGACLAGFRVSYGTSAAALSQTREAPGPNVTSAVVSGLAPGTWFFGAQAITGQGVASKLSNVASKVITAPIEITQSIGVRMPAAPANLTVE